MSLWSRLFCRKPVEHIDRNDGEDWRPGDLAVCISDTWLFDCGHDPKLNDVLRVTGVEHREVDFRNHGVPLMVAGTWLQFKDYGWRWYASGAFRKAQEDSEPCEAEFTALIKRPIQPKVKVRADAAPRQ